MRNTKNRTIFSSNTWFIIAGTIFAIALFAFSWNSFFQDNYKWVPKKGGIFTEVSEGTIQNLNPLAQSASLLDKDLHYLLFSGLLEYNPQTSTIEPMLANMRVSSNQKKYTLTIKDDARFSDGSAVTPADVFFTFEKVIKNPNFENANLRDIFWDTEITITDSNKIEFLLSAPNAFFSNALTTPILKEKNYTGAFYEEIFDPEFPGNKKAIGTGPFKLENIINEEGDLQRVFLSKNDHFIKGAPYVDNLVLYGFPKLDAHSEIEPSPTMISRISFETKKYFETRFPEKYFTNKEYTLPKVLSLYFNLDSNILGNGKLREALSLGTDKSKIEERNPELSKIDSFFFFEGVESFHETNFLEANKLLTKAKYIKNEEGIRVYKSEPMALEILTTLHPSFYSRIAQNISQNWTKNLGIPTKVTIADSFADFQERVNSGKYEVILYGIDFADNPNALSPWHTFLLNSGNISRLTNNKMDEIIEEYEATGSKSELFSGNQKLEELTVGLPLATPKNFVIINKDLFGFPDTFGKILTTSERYFGIEKWHFEKEKDWDLPANSSKISSFLYWVFNSENTKKESPDLTDTMQEKKSAAQSE